MISSASLAAFSASISASLPSVRADAVRRAHDVGASAFAAQDTAPRAADSTTRSAPVLGAAGKPAPGQVLPRGSLLDLRV